MPYANAADLTARHDINTILELLTDSGNKPPVNTIATDTRLVACLDDASGDIDSALLVGNRYSTTDLSGLTGNALARLKRLTCDITMAYLYDARPGYNTDQVQPIRARADAELEKLRNGSNVFNLVDQLAAGLPTIDGPTTIDYQRLNLIPDRITRYFPARARRLPTDRA